MGGRPQVLMHANDIAGAHGATVASWPGRPAAIGGTCVGSPTVNASGWAGGGTAAFRTLSLNGSSQYVSFNSEASSYLVDTTFVWVVAAKFSAASSGRNVLFLGASNANNYRGFTVNVTNDFAYLSSNRNGSTEFDAGTAVAEDVQGIWGILLDGGNVTIKQLINSGETTLLNTTHTMTGTLTVDRFTLGCLVSNNAPLGYTPMQARFVAARRAPVGTVTSADLSRILLHTRDNLQCPLAA